MIKQGQKYLTKQGRVIYIAGETYSNVEQGDRRHTFTGVFIEGDRAYLATFSEDGKYLDNCPEDDGSDWMDLDVMIRDSDIEFPVDDIEQQDHDNG